MAHHPCGGSENDAKTWLGTAARHNGKHTTRRVTKQSGDESQICHDKDTRIQLDITKGSSYFASYTLARVVQRVSLIQTNEAGLGRTHSCMQTSNSFRDKNDRNKQTYPTVIWHYNFPYFPLATFKTYCINSFYCHFIILCIVIFHTLNLCNFFQIQSFSVC